MSAVSGRKRRKLLPYGIGFLAGVLMLVVFNSVHGIVDRHAALEPGDLVILSGTDDSNGQRSSLVEQWNHEHPKNQARIVTLPDSSDLQHSAMVSTAQQRRDQVDVYNLDVTWTAEFAAAGYIRDLGDTDTTGFLPGPLATCRFDGKLWALPFNTDAGLLYYRSDIFRPAGQTVPGRIDLPAQQPPSSQEMVAIAAAARQAKLPEFKAGYATQLARYEGLTVNALEAIWGVGGEVISGDGLVTLDPATVRRALAPLAQGMTATGNTPPAILAESEKFLERDSAQAFAAGKVVLMRNWPVWYDQLATLSKHPADLAKKVAVEPVRDSVLGGQNLAVAAGSAHPEAAKALIEFLTGDSSERTLFGAGGLPATRADVYGYDDVQARRPYAAALLTAVREARPRPVTTHYALFSATFQDVVDHALHNDGQLPRDAVQRLTKAFNGQLP